MATIKMREKKKAGRRKGTLPGGASPSDMRKIMNHAIALQARGQSKSASMKAAWKKYRDGTL